MTGTGEWLTQYLWNSAMSESAQWHIKYKRITRRETLPIPGAPRAAPHCLTMLLGPRVPTTRESGRYRAIRRSIVSVTRPAMNSTITESYGGRINFAYGSFHSIKETHTSAWMAACILAQYVLHKLSSFLPVILVCLLPYSMRWVQSLPRTSEIFVSSPHSSASNPLITISSSPS